MPTSSPDARSLHVGASALTASVGQMEIGVRQALSAPRFTVMDMHLRHICEVCGGEEILTAEEAYAAGWDYPPHMGALGVISPRICPTCPVNGTVWWAIAIDGYPEDMLSEHQRVVIDRILGEPDTITVLPPAPGA